MSKALDAEARFKDAAVAYATLKDTGKRAAYDGLGHPQTGAEFAPRPQGRKDFSAEGASFEDIDLADLLASMERGQRGGSSAAMPVKGRGYEGAVTITLADARRGTTVNLNLNLNLNLADDAGERTFEVTIPPGVRLDQKLRLRGKGDKRDKGHNGAPHVHMYLHIALAPHPVFRPDD